MRLILSLMMLMAVCCLMLVSCSKSDTKNTESGSSESGTSVTETEAEDGALEIYKTVDCKRHHRDYHLIPYNLVKHVGVDESNEWAEEMKKNMSETTDENTCLCPDFNIKSYIDHFDVSVGDFISYGDIVYYATYDTDILYGDSVDVEEYFVYSDALIDKTITSQHFSFIERHFKYEYYSEISQLVVYDEGLGAGMYPSIPSLVQKLDIDRSAFEIILSECTDRNISVYGRSFNFDYDLGMIYEDDGSFKPLPVFDGLSEYEREMKLNRIFCGVDG